MYLSRGDIITSSRKWSRANEICRCMARMTPNKALAVTHPRAVPAGLGVAQPEGEPTRLNEYLMTFLWSDRPEWSTCHDRTHAPAVANLVDYFNRHWTTLWISDWLIDWLIQQSADVHYIPALYSEARWCFQRRLFVCWRYVALVVVLWCPALSSSSSSASASVTALRWEPVNVHVKFWCEYRSWPWLEMHKRNFW